MRHQEIKKEIIEIFNEEFYNAVVSNSDGSGLLYIKENIKISDYQTILAGQSSIRFTIFESKLIGTSVIESIQSSIFRIKTLFDKVSMMKSISTADDLLDQHYSLLQQLFMNKINEKNNSNYTLNQILISEKSKEEFSRKLKNRWNKAYQKNGENSQSGTFSEFEEKMKVNVLINTIKYF